MNFREDNNSIFMTIAKGEHINATFEAFAVEKNIGCAWINGIGAIESPEIGYYSLDSKSYIRKHFSGEFELTSLVGNITIREGKPFSHTHITFSDTDYRVFGGHLFDAKITAAGEFILNTGSRDIPRNLNDNIGLPLWCLEGSIG